MTAPMQDVSRETQAKLDAYVELLLRWTKRINLIAPGTAPDIWTRHIEDSVQVARFCPQAKTWVDLGSGGGLPGVVISVVRPDLDMHLVESDARKCSFLRTAARELGLAITVHNSRAEQVAPMGADVVSARALAPLDVLLGYVHRHASPAGCALLPKGENWAQEVQKAQETWSFTYTAHPSQTGPGTILELGELAGV